MPGNVISVNGSNGLEWYVGDSHMPELLCYLSRIGSPRTQDAEKLQVEVHKSIKKATDHLGIGEWLNKPPDEVPTVNVTITAEDDPPPAPWKCPECDKTFTEMFGTDGYQAHFAKEHMVLQEGGDASEMFSKEVWNGLSDRDRQKVTEQHKESIKKWMESILENGCVKCSGTMEPYGATHKCQDCGWVLDYVQLSPVISQKLPVLCSRCDSRMLKLPGGYHCMECGGKPTIGFTTDDGPPRLHPKSIYIGCRTCGTQMRFEGTQYECPKCHVTTEIPAQNHIYKCSYPDCNQWFNRFNTKTAEEIHMRTHLKHDSTGPALL